MDKNLLLYLPFDDPDGAIAYDYSQNRNDATLSDGAAFVKDGKRYKALALNGTGLVQTAQQIKFDQPFTLMLYVKTAGKKIGWMLNVDGVDTFLEQWLDVVPGAWTAFAFVNELFEGGGGSFTAYMNGTRISYNTYSENLLGFSINDENVAGTEALIDEVRLYSVAMKQSEINNIERGTDVEYFINGKNFKDFGVYVSASKGLVGRLGRKETLTVDWDNYHGKVRDKKRMKYKEREIELDCFIEAPSRTAFVQRVSDFFDEFDHDGTQRFKVELDGDTKPLIYEVVMLDPSDPDKKWGHYSSGLMVGTFKIKLVEDEPVKRVLRHIGATANTNAHIKVTSSKLLNIYWGDGTATFNVSGANVEQNHIYPQPGEYEIVVTGVIEEIENFETNAIILWSNLH